MKKAIAIVIAVPVLLVAAATVLVRLYLTDARVRALVVPAAEKALGRRVTLGGISVSLFSGIEVRDLTVAGPDGRGVFAGVDSLLISYRLLPLLRKRIEVSRIALEGPRVNISRDRDGRFNFSSLALLATPAGDGRDGPAAGGRAALSIGVEKITVSNGRVTVSDRTGAIPDTEADIDLDMGLELAGGAPRFAGRAAATVRCSYDGARPVVGVEADFDQERVRADLDVNIDGERMRVAATVRNYLTAPDTDLLLSADRLDLGRLVAIAAGSGGKAAAGTETAAGPAEKTTAPAGLPPVTGRVAVKRLTYLDLEAGDLAVSFHTDGNRLLIDGFALTACGGGITGEAVLTAGEPLAYEGRAAAKDISIAALRKGLRRTGGGIADGLASVDAVFSGRGSSWPGLADHLSASGAYSLRQARITRNPYTEILAAALGDPHLAELTASDIRGKYRVENGRLLLSGALASREIGLAGKGSVGLAAADLDFRLTATLPASLAAKLPPDLAGSVAGKDGTVPIGLTLRGRAGSPRLGIDRAGLKDAVRKKAKQRAAAEAEKLISKELGGRPEAGMVRDAAGTLLNGLFGGDR